MRFTLPFAGGHGLIEDDLNLKAETLPRGYEELAF
jgi:hypothetical protein